MVNLSVIKAHTDFGMPINIKCKGVTFNFDHLSYGRLRQGLPKNKLTIPWKLSSSEELTKLRTTIRSH